MTLPNYNWPAGSSHTIDDSPYKFVPGSIPDRFHFMCARTGQPFLVPSASGAPELPTAKDIDELILAERLIVQLPKNTLDARRAAAKTDWDTEDCERADPKAKKIQKQCEVLDDAGVRNGIKSVTIGLSRYWTSELREQFGDHDNPHSVKRWRAERGVPGNRDLRECVRMSGRVPRGGGFDDTIEQIKQKHALRKVSSHDPIRAAFFDALLEIDLVNRGLSNDYVQPDKPYTPFSYSTFYRACRALAGDEAMEARDGKQMVESRARGAGRPISAGRAMEKVIIDHTPLDAFVIVDPERGWICSKPWLTLAIDVHSRAIVGWLITLLPPSYFTVAQIMLRMNLPKRPPERHAGRFPILRRLCGRANEVICDNALEFVKEAHRDLARRLGTGVTFAPIKKPRYKSIGERAMGSVPRLMLEGVPGRTFGIAHSREAGYDATKVAEFTMTGIEAVAVWAIAEYNIAGHEALDERPPALVFQKSANRHGIDVFHDVRALKLEVMEVRRNVRVTKSGVEIFGGLRYQDIRGVPRLLNNNLRYEPRRHAPQNATIQTHIKFDPSDISRIYVFDRHENRYVELRCDQEDYSDGMPLAFHEELRRQAAEEARAFATEKDRILLRAERIAYIKSIAPKAAQAEKDAVGRLYEHGRIRAITGEIVSLDFDYQSTDVADHFVGHDTATRTSFDRAVDGATPSPSRRRKPDTRRDPRSAGEPEAARPPRRSARSSDSEKAA